MSTLMEINVDHGDLSKQLADKLRNYIVEQGLRPGGRLPSNREIAQQAKVSQVTARMAIKRLEKEGLLECRIGQGSFVRCLPQVAEAKKRQATGRRIGVILSPWDSRDKLAWDNRDLISGLINEFCRTSVQMIIFSYQQWLDYATHDPFAIITENDLNGLVWLHCSARETAFIAKLEERKFPQVLLNRRSAGLSCAAVLQDQTGMINDMVNRMTAAELESYLIICGDPAINPYQERYETLQKRLGAGNHFDPRRILQLPEEPYPAWTPDLLRQQLDFWKCEIIIDLVGYAEIVGEIIKESHRPVHLVSVCPPDAWKQKCNFQYDYYSFDLCSAGRYVSQMLNDDTKTVMLPFSYHSCAQV